MATQTKPRRKKLPFVVGRPDTYDGRFCQIEAFDEQEALKEYVEEYYDSEEVYVIPLSDMALFRRKKEPFEKVLK